MALECIVRWDSRSDAMKAIEYGVVYRAEKPVYAVTLVRSFDEAYYTVLHNFYSLPCCSHLYIGVLSISSLQLPPVLNQAIFYAKKAPADHISVKDRGRFYSNESVIV